MDRPESLGIERHMYGEIGTFSVDVSAVAGREVQEWGTGSGRPGVGPAYRRVSSRSRRAYSKHRSPGWSEGIIVRVFIR
ncbi:MAG: hypothetical protein ABSB94_21320 [Syntrophorhabdales bacterium]